MAPTTRKRARSPSHAAGAEPIASSSSNPDAVPVTIGTAPNTETPNANKKPRLDSAESRTPEQVAQDEREEAQVMVKLEDAEDGNVEEDETETLASEKTPGQELVVKQEDEDEADATPEQLAEEAEESATIAAKRKRTPSPEPTETPAPSGTPMAESHPSKRARLVAEEEEQVSSAEPEQISQPPSAATPSEATEARVTKRKRADSPYSEERREAPSRATPKFTSPGPKPTFTSLPLEILTEILIETHSVATVLAVSLTCRHFREVIGKSKEVEFVWRSVRKSDEGKCVAEDEFGMPLDTKVETKTVDWKSILGLVVKEGENPVTEDDVKENAAAVKEYFRLFGLFQQPVQDGEVNPDSTADEEVYQHQLERQRQRKEPVLFTEQQWAQFVHGGGICEQCKKSTKRTFVSYALRIRLCENRKCETEFAKSGALVLNDALIRHGCDKELIPKLEDRDTLHGVQPAVFEVNTMSHAAFNTVVLRLTRKELPKAVTDFMTKAKQPAFATEALKIKSVHTKWMQVCRELVVARRLNREMFYMKKQENEKRGKAIAEELGLNFEDLMNCTDYGPYHRNKNHVMESISKVDIQARLPTIKLQLERLSDKRERRIQEIVYQETRKQVFQHWKSLRNAIVGGGNKKDKAPPTSARAKAKLNARLAAEDIGGVIPSLASFRTLPVIEMLQETAEEGAAALLNAGSTVDGDAAAAPATTATGGTKRRKAAAAPAMSKDPSSVVHVGKSLKTDTALMAMLKTQIGAWVDQARVDLGKIAKVFEEEATAEEQAQQKKGRAGRNRGKGKAKEDAATKWKSINKNEVHPVERMSVRFRCVKCKGVGMGVQGGGGGAWDAQQAKYEDDECFDFKGACAHDCYRDGGRKLLWKWAPDHFEKDEKASAAIKKYLELTGLDEKLSTCQAKVKALEDATFVVCTSCPVPIVMRFDSLAGHSHRHDDMQFRLLSSPPGEDLIGKFGLETTGSVRLLKKDGMASFRDEKVYGCRICYMQARNEWLANKQAAAGEDGQGETSQEAAEAVPDNLDEEIKLASPLYTFDGLRSHLKAKPGHLIPDIREEDFFIVMAVPAEPAVAAT